LTEKFVIGTIGSPFGVKGFVKIRSLSGETDHLLKLKSVIINVDSKERLLQIEESSLAGGANPAVLMRFAGFDTPEAVKTLNGAQLIANRDQAAPLADGEHYIEDLKGLDVCVNYNDIKALNLSSLLCASASPREGLVIIGAITDVIEGGGGELAEIKLANGEKKLIPFRKEFFKEITTERAVLQNCWILE